MDYYTKSETFSAQWPFTYAGNKLYLHKKKKKSLLISNVNNNLGNSAAGGTCYEPTCHFQYWQCKIQEDLKTPQKPPYEQKVEYSKK